MVDSAASAGATRVIEYPRFCKQPQQRATVVSARQFMEQVATQRGLALAVLENWKEVFRWYSREGQQSSTCAAGAAAAVSPRKRIGGLPRRSRARSAGPVAADSAVLYGSAMSLHQIQEAIQDLPADQQQQLRAWLEQLLEDQRPLDPEFVASIERGRRDIAAGRSRQP